MNKSVLLIAVFGILSASAANASASNGANIRPFYTCQYDGARDSRTWQLAGEGVPPAGAVQCRQAGPNYCQVGAADCYPQYCNQVVDAQGNTLGQGNWCGDENDASAYNEIQAYL